MSISQLRVLVSKLEEEDKRSVEVKSQLLTLGSCLDEGSVEDEFVVSILRKCIQENILTREQVKEVLSQEKVANKVKNECQSLPITCIDVVLQVGACSVDEVEKFVNILSLALFSSWKGKVVFTSHALRQFTEKVLLKMADFMQHLFCNRKEENNVEYGVLSILQFLLKYFEVVTLTDEREIKLALLCLDKVKNTDSSHSYRLCKAFLSCYSTILGNEVCLKQSHLINQYQSLFIDFCQHEDCRIRRLCLETLSAFSTKMAQSTILRTCFHLLTDVDYSVSIAALRLLVCLVSANPCSLHESKVALAFEYVCKMMTDLRVEVRIEACKALAEFSSLCSPIYLKQSLDKKPISLKEANATEMANESFDRFNRGVTVQDGQAFSSRFLRENVFGDVQACGALIQGLEDEHHKVRSLAVQAMAKLAKGKNAGKFARSCVDFILDMLNDDIIDVRLNAIHALQELTKFLCLNTYQVDIVLSGLEDRCYDIKQGLCDLVCASPLLNTQSLALVLDRFLHHLEKHPSDKTLLHFCFKSLGLNNSCMVLALLHTLLNLSSGFDFVEKDINDESYICYLILIFNACSKVSLIVSLLPEAVKKHHLYLRNALSQGLVPFNLIEPREHVSKEEDDRKWICEAYTEICDTMKCLSGLKITHESMQNISSFKSLLSEMKMLRELHHEMNDVSHFLELYLECNIKAANFLNLCFSHLPEKSNVLTCSQTLFSNLTHLVTCFKGLTSHQLFDILYLQLVLAYFNLFTLCHKTKYTDGIMRKLALLRQTNQNDGIDPCNEEKFADSFDEFVRILKLTHEMFKDQRLNKFLYFLDTKSCEKSSLLMNSQYSLIFPQEISFVAIQPDLFRLKRIHAEIVQPLAGTSDKALACIAAFSISVTAIFNAHNVDCERDFLAIQLRYPNGFKKHFFMSQSDVKCKRESLTTFESLLYFGDSVAWSSEAQVEMTIVLCLDKHHFHPLLFSHSHFVEISEKRIIYIHPKHS